MKSYEDRSALGLRLPLLLLTLASASVSLGSLGCDGGEGDDTGDLPAIDAAPMIDATPSAAGPEAHNHSDSAWIQGNNFAKSCFFNTSCHNANANAPAGLSLTKALAHGEIVNVASTQVPAKMRVAPGSCEDSYLYDKITNSPAIKAGEDPMPPTFDAMGNPVLLCPEKVAAICRWIEAGALNDGTPDAGPPSSDPGF